MSTRSRKIPWENAIYVRRWYFKKGQETGLDIKSVIRKTLRELGIKAKIEPVAIMPVLSVVFFNNKEDMNLFCVSGHFNRLNDELYGKPIYEYAVVS